MSKISYQVALKRLNTCNNFYCRSRSIEKRDFEPRQHNQRRHNYERSDGPNPYLIKFWILTLSFKITNYFLIKKNKLLKITGSFRKKESAAFLPFELN